MEFKFNECGLSIFWKHAGLISFWLNELTIHVGVQKDCQMWGRDTNYYDGIEFKSWGLGPIILICRL